MHVLLRIVHNIVKENRIPLNVDFNHIRYQEVNSAFACEVFLKALLVFYGETQLRNHKLKDLWLDLEEKDEETTLSIKRSIKDWFASDDDNLFDRLLDDASEAFVYWRYIYEKQDGSININFLRGFRFLLRDICCKRFYNKSWKEFVDG